MERSRSFPLRGKGNDLLKVATTSGSEIKPRCAEQSGALNSRSLQNQTVSFLEIKNVNVLFGCLNWQRQNTHLVPERNNCPLLLGIESGKLLGDLPSLQAAVNVKLSEIGKNRGIKNIPLHTKQFMDYLCAAHAKKKSATNIGIFQIVN